MNSVMRSFIKPRDLESSQEFLMNHNPFIFFLAEEKDNQDSVQMITTMPFSRRNRGTYLFLMETHVFQWHKWAQTPVNNHQN